MPNSKGHHPVGYRRRSSDGAERSCWLRLIMSASLVLCSGTKASNTVNQKKMPQSLGSEERRCAVQRQRITSVWPATKGCGGCVLTQVSRIESLYQHPRRVTRVTWSTRRRPTNRPTEPAIRLHLIATVDSQRPRQTSPVLVEGRRTLCWCVPDTHYDSATRLVVQTALRNTVNRCAISCSE